MPLKVCPGYFLRLDPGVISGPILIKLVAPAVRSNCSVECQYVVYVALQNSGRQSHAKGVQFRSGEIS